MLKGDPAGAKKNVRLIGHDAGLAGKMTPVKDGNGNDIPGKYTCSRS